MLASLLRVAALLPLAAAAVIPAAATPAAEDSTATPAPVQLLTLTDAAGQATGIGQDGPTASDAPATTSSGAAVAPALIAGLAALDETVSPADRAAVLTDPVAVDEFLVAGFTWKGSAELPAGMQIYLRVRENGEWTSWYLNSPADAGRDDGIGLHGTDEFVTGGADAVQAAVVGDPSAMPSDLTLALVPSNPDGQEHLAQSDVSTVEAQDTPVDPGSAQTSDASGTSGTERSQASAPSTATASPSASPTPSVTASPSETATAEPIVGGGTSAGTSTKTALRAALAALVPTSTTPVTVTSRSEWGADESYMTWTPSYVDASHVVIHHTAGSNDYTASQSASIVRGIYYYHAVTLGWGDIGYNFLVDKYGQVFEGRSGSLAAPLGKMVVGGHALGANTGSMGISMIGDYTFTAPSSAQLTSVGKMAGWFLARAGVTSATSTAPFTIRTTVKYTAGQVVDLPVIFAHRDVNYTTCPGDAGYAKMGTIRSIAQAQIEVSNALEYLNDAWSGTANTVLEHGLKTSQIVAGDWDGNGTDTLARRDGNIVGFRNTNTSGDSLRTFAYGRAGDEVYVGDWDGNGTDTIAVRRGATFYIRNSMTTGAADVVVTYGRSTDDVYVGDWNGDGRDTFAVRRGNVFYLSNTLTSTTAEALIAYGTASDTVLVGDWNGDEKDSFAVRRSATYLVRNSMESGPAELSVTYGRPSDAVIVGDWNGDKRDTLGVVR